MKKLSERKLDQPINYTPHDTISLEYRDEEGINHVLLQEGLKEYGSFDYVAALKLFHDDLVAIGMEDLQEALAGIFGKTKE